MRCNLICVTTALAAVSLFSGPASGSVLYNNLTPNNLMAMASRPSGPGVTEVEAADDFVLGSSSIVNSASFVGLFQPGTGLPSIASVVIEIYRVFPNDSNIVRSITVPTRANSPSDVDLASRDSSIAGDLSFTSSVLNSSFTALNSVQAGGIHASPNQTTLGNGAVTGQEVQIDVTFNNPIVLPADHYFFIPQVTLTNGAQFLWLSASRPISGLGTTPIAPDLQAWIRDGNLAPDWLRVGTDIVGGTTPPTFNAAFSLDGVVTPEPGTPILLLMGLVILGVWWHLRSGRRNI